MSVDDHFSPETDYNLTINLFFQYVNKQKINIFILPKDL